MMTRNEALKAAKGKWQRQLILWGQAEVHPLYSNSYDDSVENLIERLKKMGFPVYTHYQEYTWYLVVEEGWVKILRKLDFIVDLAEETRAKLNDEVEDKELLKRTRLRKSLIEVRNEAIRLRRKILNEIYPKRLEVNPDEFLPQINEMKKKLELLLKSAAILFV